MKTRMRRPETVRLEISNGDWLLVKKHLTAGEHRKMLDGMLREDTQKVAAMKIGTSQVCAYLLDWSLIDLNDKKIAIMDDEKALLSALDAIDVESFEEIFKAIDAHAAAMKAERAKEKALPFTEPGSTATSPSPAP